MPHPNFFLIGAQKCGTDALYYTLKQHPDIFMSPNKEPAYFTMDGALPNFRKPAPGYRHRLVYDREKYHALFADAGDRPVIGEASAIYLSSYYPERTAARIFAAAPHARLVALLRQPADRAYSAHNFYRSRSLEPISDFRAALAAEEQRIHTNEIPDIRHRANGMYFANLTPYFHVFPRAQIRIYLQEDLRTRPRQTLRDLFEFLGVPDRPEIEVPRANVTSLNRSQKLWHFLEHPTPRQLRLRRRIPATMVKLILRWNRFRPPPIDPSLRRSLTNEFRDDILRLERLIDRDLSHWLME